MPVKGRERMNVMDERSANVFDGKTLLMFSDDLDKAFAAFTKIKKGYCG